jgi:hypothetical protein
MVQIKLTEVWENLVDYYYKNIQPKDITISIWDFVETEFHGKRTFRWGQREQDIKFIFENDADATAFKLKFLVTEHT